VRLEGCGVGGGVLGPILAQKVLAAHGPTKDPQLKVRLCIWCAFSRFRAVYLIRA
jgi:hypothetical protein